VIFVTLNNFQIKSAQNASSLLRFKDRYINDMLLQDYAQSFLFKNNGNTSLLVETLLNNDFYKVQAFDTELVR